MSRFIHFLFFPASDDFARWQEENPLCKILSVSPALDSATGSMEGADAVNVAPRFGAFVTYTVIAPNDLCPKCGHAMNPGLYYEKAPQSAGDFAGSEALAHRCTTCHYGEFRALSSPPSGAAHGGAAAQTGEDG